MSFKTFASEAEARAFIAGVEYVNDPTLTAYLSDADPCCVVLEDEDCDEDTSDDPSGVFFDSILSA